MKKKSIRVRCWVDVDGVQFFGLGRAELLRLIQESGSISKAAKTMGMSYKKAWGMIDALNQGGQKPYVIPRTGGQQGGGAKLTTTGKKVVEAYEKLIKKLSNLVDKETELLRLI